MSKKLLCVSAVILGLFAPGASGQYVTRRFTLELSANAGGTFDFPGAGAYAGICFTGTNNCNQQLKLGKKSLPLFGGGVALSVTRFIWLYGDFDHSLSDDQTASAAIGTGTITTTVDRQYQFATGGVQFAFPTVHRVVPFVRVGGGEVHHHYDFSQTGTNVTGLSSRFDDEWIPAVSVGGGIRWYLGERQGFRFLIEGLYLSHGIEEAAAPTNTTGVAFISRRSGGVVSIAYFRQLFGHRR